MRLLHRLPITGFALITMAITACSSQVESIREAAPEIRYAQQSRPNPSNSSTQVYPYPDIGSPTNPQSPYPYPGPSFPSAPQSPAPGSMGSGGQGGATGLVESRFTASNGKNSSYKTKIPADVANKIYGLNIHLHGDGGGDYRWLFEDNVRIGLQHNLIGVVVLAPNAERKWYRQGEQNALFLHELIQNEITRRYNIDLNRVYFSGVSGGSQFLTGQFIPLYGKHYRSGAVMLCGGPANWMRELNMNSADIAAFRLSWYATAGDFLLKQVNEGIRYYRGRGFKVFSEILPTGAHCRFPGGVDAALEKKLREIVRPT